MARRDWGRIVGATAVTAGQCFAEQNSAATIRGMNSHPAKRGDRQFAHTLERGLRVMGCFSGSAPELGNAEIAAATGLPKPTVSRLTHTLVQLGYLRRRPDSARFELGPSVLSLGHPVLAGLLRFRRLALPHMAELARALQGTVSVAARDRLQMVAVENVTERDVLRRKPGTGLRTQFGASTAGLAWLVAALPHERERTWRELAHAQPELLDTVRADYEQALLEYRRDAYVLSFGRLRADTAILSAPLHRAPGEEQLVLSCAIDAPPARAAALARRAGTQLLATVRAIGQALAGP